MKSVRYRTSNEGPFLEHHWKDDVLGYQDVAADFTRLLYTIREPLVIGINSPYGTGKTFFLKRWLRDLDAAGHTTVYFNAWETDYSESPLISFVVALRETFRDKKIDIPQKVLRGLASTTGKIILEIGKGIVNEAVGFDSEKIIEHEMGKARESAYGVFAEDKIDGHLKAREGIKQFKAHLKKIAESISSKDAKKKPIYVFIDELDRCKPTYAIELLEQIKHIFSTDHYIFILAIDDKQLASTVRSVYGSDTDANGYLRKFIDYNLSLPRPDSHKFASYLYDLFSFVELYRDGDTVDDLHGHKTLIDSFGRYSDVFRLSLREQVQCFSEINSSVRLAEPGTPFFPRIISFVACLRVKCPDVYQKIGKSFMNDYSQMLTSLQGLLPPEVMSPLATDKELKRQMNAAFITDNQPLDSSTPSGNLYLKYIRLTKPPRQRIIDHIKKILDLGARYH